MFLILLGLCRPTIQFFNKKVLGEYLANNGYFLAYNRPGLWYMLDKHTGEVKASVYKANTWRVSC